MIQILVFVSSSRLVPVISSGGRSWDKAVRQKQPLGLPSTNSGSQVQCRKKTLQVYMHRF